jgi:hypothetical protein
MGIPMILTNAKRSISVCVFTSCPNPARICLIYFLPESFMETFEGSGTHTAIIAHARVRVACACVYLGSVLRHFRSQVIGR